MIVTCLHPADPVGTIPGGIDSFIRGLIKWAPAWVDYRLIGVTTDPGTRPVGRWSQCELGGKTFEFYPVMALDLSLRQRTRVPLTLSFTANLRPALRGLKTDVLEFHRIEPVSLPLSLDKSSIRALFMHQNMESLYSTKSDIFWRFAPSVYFWLERALMHKIDVCHCVSMEGTASLRKRYPDAKTSFDFCPTWPDVSIFSVRSEAEHVQRKSELISALGFQGVDEIVTFVGRLDSQKDPSRLLRSFRLLTRSRLNVGLVFVGDGILRDRLQSEIETLGLAATVRIIGVRPPLQVAEILKGTDFFALSSAYEGMPISVLEALSCGVPVVSTNVGEVSRVVETGRNGELVRHDSDEAFAAAMETCLNHRAQYSGAPCVDAVRDYTPGAIVPGIFSRYQRSVRDKGVAIA